MDFKSKCIICGHPDNLTARLTVLVGNQDYEVSLCEKHEEITPKQVRIEVTKKLQEFSELTKKLKEFGYEVKDNPIIIPTPQEIRQLVPQRRAEPSRPKPIIEEQIEENPDCPVEESAEPILIEKQPQQQRVLREQKINRKDESYQINKSAAQPSPHVRAVGGSVSGHGIAASVEGRSSLNPQEELKQLSEKMKTNLPVLREVTKQTVPGRGGVNMTIPKMIRDTSGVTHIKVVNTGGNESLQKRFRAIKDAGDQSQGANPVAGYTSIDCNLCRGGGRVKNKGIDQKCPKCNGRGIIDKLIQ